MYKRLMKLLVGKKCIEHSLGGILLEQMLMFPTVVVLFVSVTLLLGGKCSIWQWWTSVLLVLAYPFRRNSWRIAATAGGWFLVGLYVIWILSGISITREWWDCHTYHFPAIRMLMLGWNPVWESTRDSIEMACGHPASLNVWPVLSMPRSVWYFSAVAAFFSRNQFDFYHPIVLFFMVCGVGYFWKSEKRMSVFIKAVTAIFIVSVSQIYMHALDMVMALSALGVFSLHYSYLKNKDWQPVPAVCFSFWMCSAKQPGIAFCAIAWISFAICVFVRERLEWKHNLMRFLRIASVVAGLFAVANVSPFVTSFINYGHPLYPQFTVNEEKYPSVNFTADFKEVNDDAMAMSNRIAMFLNAFVSHDIVRDFYAWKLNNPDFRPRGQTWKQGGGKGGWDTPLNDESRYWIMIPIVLMLVLGWFEEKFLAIVMLLCAMAVPTEMIGLLRYVSMVQFSFIFCIPMMWRLTERRYAARFVCAVAIIWLMCGRICCMLEKELEYVDDRLTIYKCFKKGLPETVYYNKFVLNHKVFASLNLMKHLVPQMDDIELATIPDEMYAGAKGIDLVSRAKITKRLNSEYPQFPDWSFRVPKWYDIGQMSELRHIRSREQKPNGAWAAKLYELRMFFKGFAAVVPHAMWLRMSGEIDNHMRKGHVKPAERVAFCGDASLGMLQRWGVNIAYEKCLSGDAMIRGVSELKLTYPRWLKRDKMQGVSLEGVGLSGDCSLTFTGGGDVVFYLKGPMVVDLESKLIPVYADFESFKINGIEMLAAPVQTLHDKAHKISYHVNQGDRVEVVVQLKPHQYGREALRGILLDATDTTHVIANEADAVLSDIRMIPFIDDGDDEMLEDGAK